MGWPKGKPRKKAELVKKEAKKDVVTKSDSLFDPKPDMGGVKEPVKVGTCECGHLTTIHYGGPAKWCNTAGCNCPEFLRG